MPQEQFWQTGELSLAQMHRIQEKNGRNVRVGNFCEKFCCKWGEKRKQWSKGEMKAIFQYFLIEEMKLIYVYKCLLMGTNQKKLLLIRKRAKNP